VSNGHDIPDLQRVTFFSGQRLTAEDLAEIQKVQRERIWLHNRSLHGWGIGIGLAVTGDSGASTVEIGEGYAVDCLGREIILTEPKSLTVPAVAGTPSGGEVEYYLVAGYQNNADQAFAEQRPGVCVPGGTVRLTEEPRLEWREAIDLEEGLDLILAKAWVKNCQLSRPLSLLERRSARPSQHPYIAANQTEAGGTEWQIWSDGGEFQGVLVRVDTSMARFQTTPWYMAHVVGERYFSVNDRSVLIVGEQALTEPTPTGFTFRIHIGAGGPAHSGMSPEDYPSTLRDDLSWQVVWLGIAT
jgi:hypothetical protein